METIVRIPCNESSMRSKLNWLQKNAQRLSELPPLHLLKMRVLRLFHCRLLQTMCDPLLGLAETLRKRESRAGCVILPNPLVRSGRLTR